MPPPAHHFTPVWPLHEPQQSFRSKKYAPPSRKRKRQQALNDESEDSDVPIEPLEPLLPSTDIKDPYRVAGWSRQNPLPASSFPHAPAVKAKTRNSHAKHVQKELAGLKPPLYVAPSPELDTVTSLRRHHLSVITTILHTSLLRRDYVRAGRAWGMILRTNVLGRPVDVRTHGRWGIGAEILMRKCPADNTAERKLGDAQIISDEGFEAAKDYYERLILQHPYQKTNPNAISSLTFYPAMFGLCIYEIQQKRKLALQRVRDASSDLDHSNSDMSLDQNQDLKDDATLKLSELASAASLADRMDQLMLSPPFDTYPALLQLRASVALWLADLYIATAKSQEDSDENRERASAEKAKARRCLDRMRTSDVKASDLVLNALG
jgi:hypothetical protein